MKITRLLMFVFVPVMTLLLPLTDAQAQPPTSCQTMDLAIAIPSQQSSSDWTTLRNFLDSALRQVVAPNNDIRIAVITYAGTATLNFNFNAFPSIDGVVNTINGLPQISASGRNVGAAMAIMRDSLFQGCPLRNGSLCVAMVIYDRPPDDQTLVDLVADNFNLRGIQVLTLTTDISATLLLGGTLPAFNTAFNYNFDSINVVDATATSAFICTYIAPACFVQIDVGFIIDESSSISASSPAGGDNWGLIVSAVQAIIETFPIGPTLTRIGMVRFSTAARLSFTFDQFPTVSSLRRYVSSMILTFGETNYADAFRLANSRMFNSRRQGKKTIAIMITDGLPTQEINQTFVHINATKNSDIEIFAIGVGTAINFDEIRRVASDPDQTHAFVATFTQLQQIVNTVSAQVCTLAIAAASNQTVPPPSTSSASTTTTTRTTTTTTIPPIPTTVSTTRT